MDKIKSCYDYEVKLASGLVQQVQAKIQNGEIKKRNFIWLELTGCSGNIISLLDGKNPDFKYLASQMVRFVYDNSLAVKQGESAAEALYSVLDKDFILAVEGAVTTKANGLYNIIGMFRGKKVTAYDAIRTFGEKASHVLAVGMCASDGGPSAAKPNPAECVSVQQVLKRKVIRLPGCPCNPDWFLGTLAYILLYGEPELDNYNRPLMFYGTRIHDRCQRRSFFDKGIFAAKLGDSACMFKLGCRGPVTRTDCPVRKWNEYVNWPVQDGTPCIGCAMFGFPDKMEPFISYDTTRGGSPE